jgi:hypothetical protein
MPYELRAGGPEGMWQTVHFAASSGAPFCTL